MSATARATFALRRPCAKCPFRADVPGYLRRKRAQDIATSIAGGAIFYCHQTTEEVDDELVGTERSSFCAGALILMEKAEAPNQAMRTAERLGLYDPERMDTTAPVHASFVEFVRHHGDDEDTSEEVRESCSVANHGCEAPAGMLVGGHAIETDPDDMGEVHPCPSCGDPVCDSCSNEDGECAYCGGEDD